ncbi:MAG: hypothetical protein C5B52_05050 [Bacteroidetes bacterium]|nr:MAG: hypothetical protein C5B52_05050 [Bacteroidota bacterium]
MIAQLSNRHSQKIACLLATIFYTSLIFPGVSKGNMLKQTFYAGNDNRRHDYRLSGTGSEPSGNLFGSNSQHAWAGSTMPKPTKNTFNHIGGPGQPEMASFKPVGTNNMVNLFTGDFSYNIPLLDVGGYPINIYYEGGITMEQEASWVGLGWNLNPGNISRNMRGVPDDFNGQDTLTQMQIMKPNKTWGLGIGADLELLGIKAPIKAELGVAFNNYLGPSLDLSLRGNAAYKIGNIAGSEKTPASMGVNLGVDINSRSGTSFSAGVSLTGSANFKNNSTSFGVGLSTGYNSRSGIKALQIYEQASYNYKQAKSGAENKSNDKHLTSYSLNENLYSTTISFAKPSYTPSLRMPLTNTAWSGHFQLGLGSFGVAADVEAEVYGQKSEVAPADTMLKKPMVGYLYYQNAASNPGWVMDFTRFNDREVTPNTPVISIPQYSYDVFTIQGEGTGGSIRAFRNDLGYVRDNITTSKDKNLSLGGDIDPPGHYGGNFNTVKTPSAIGEWGKGNKLRNAIQFTNANGTFENVYFRNPGENCVIDSNRFIQVGGTDLVRFVLGGSNNSPTIEPKLQSYSNSLKPGIITDLSTKKVITERNKRSQVVNFLTAAETQLVGLDKYIRSYDNVTFLDVVADTLIYEKIPRVDGIIRKAHHISQINVTENNGRRYVYGIPVYNLTQTDFTFSVDNAYSQIPDKVLLNPALNYTNSRSALLTDGSQRDGYVQVTTTPPYAHSFLLSGILSPDYVDVTGDGISDDDIGDAVKFNYTRIKNGSDRGHYWRTPLSGPDSANFHAGSRSEVKDDKAMISYGERESWYLASVESKTMIALFYVSRRSDGKGTVGPAGGIYGGDFFVKKLDSIALFSKPDLKANGLAKAKAIKTVHFVYTYQLCQGTPDDTSSISGSKGKLTLQSIYFTYNGKTRAFKNNYSFSYLSAGVENLTDNPIYASGSSDRWGTYKSASLNPGGLKNNDYPYTIQDTAQATTVNQNASAWMLKKIILPSGGQLEMTYEADDYAFVQNRRASEMMKVVGFGTSNVYSASSDRLYPITNTSGTENDYVFIQVPVACNNATDVFNLYLQGMTQLSFKIWVLMPKGPEFIPCYANFSAGNYGVDATNHNVIWVKMDRIAGKSPLSVTTLEYLRQQLPGQAFPGYDVSGEPALKQVGDMLLAMLNSLRDAFTDPINAFRKDGKAMHTDLTKCFARLNDPFGRKKGGGYRVKTVTLKDNWNTMTGQFTASYGQKYDYTTTESFNGTQRQISSGVASYEPSIGGEENPFQSIIQVQDYLPAGPTSFGAVEMPAMDAFFPAPLVGYSKVTVTAIKMDTSTAKKTRSGIGKQVTEYYTARDFPVYTNYTPFDAGSVKEFHQASTLAFFNKYSYDYKAQSQGFLVATNDMHGKMKSQSSYAENDSLSRISYTENFYRNTGTNGLNDKFTFVGKDNSGTSYSGNMGIDIDLMTDTREFSVKSTSLEIQGQVDIFYFVFPIPVPTIWPVSGTAENIYRAVTTTKVINYHGVLDSVVVIDKGSQVSTKNLAYDSYTGEVLVSRSNNEFNQPVYSTGYPAYWAYGGMGLAYKNINATYTGITFSDGKITTAGFDFSVFESGDEILVSSATTGTGCDAQIASGMKNLIWAFDKNKNNTSLITTPDFIFLDEKGTPFTMSAVNFRIIRSGHRNMLDQKTETVTGADNPLATGKLVFNSSSKVINASATEYKEKWFTDNDVFNHLRQVVNACVISEVPDSLGYMEKSINPYLKGLIGNFKAYRSMVFYDSRKEYDSTSNTNIAANGYLNNFKLYWDFNASSNLVPDSTSTQWVWNSRLNRVNGKSLELETVDPRGVYTSAEYGYYKSIPVAIANNARYSEMFADGFEDYGFGESLYPTTYNFRNRHLNFATASNCSIINTSSSNFAAHTGKYVLAVNSGTTAILPIPVQPQPDNSIVPTLTLQKDTIQNLSTLGGNYAFATTVPHVVPAGNQGTPTFSSTNGGFTVGILPLDTIYSSSNTRMHYYTISGSFYMNVTTANTYTFNTSMSSAYNLSGVTVYQHSNGLAITITDLLGNVINNYSFSQDAFNYTQASYNQYLCAGVYLISFSGTELYNATNNGATGTNNTYAWSCPGVTTPDYKNLTKVGGCSFTKAMSSDASMLNGLFSVPANKKMVFSAWVHENCGDPVNGIPCKEYTYSHNQVQLQFVGGQPARILNPVGPIIDGWQRYEDTFKVWSTTSSMSLYLVNTSTTQVYFDDIRMHPFNASIKSYVYDPVNLRLVSELDANNYASFYEYDEEGVLVRTKIETKDGVKTVKESRSALQKIIQ